jgi:nucleotide-binding universal stress UspA family protein
VQLARAAVRFSADLLVVGTRGEHDMIRGRATLGGTSTKLVGMATVPLLLVRTPAASAPTSVLACVDLSSISAEVLSWARGSLTDGGTLTAFHAYEAPFSARLDAYGIAKESIGICGQEYKRQRQELLDALVRSVMDEKDVRRILVHGDPIDEILERVREIQPDLIALGKHTHPARRRSVSWIGSVLRHIALFALTNLLIVSSPE